MATILSQIADLVDAIVRAAVPAGTVVFRDRADAISREECPALNQVWHEAPAEAFAEGWDLHALDLELQFHVRAEPMTTPAEVLHQAVHGQLFTSTALKALADSVRLVEQLADLAEADVTSGIKTARYRIKYLIPMQTL